MSSIKSALKFVQTPSLEIAYEESGTSSDSPPVIGLHGWPYSIRQFDTLTSILLSKNQGQRVLVPYLRGFGATRYLDPASLRSGEQAALSQDLLDFMDALSISRALLVGFDWGGRAACIVAALNPWRVVGLISCQGYAIQNIPLAANVPATPTQSHALWYQYYLNSPMASRDLRNVGYRKELCKFIWQLWSPNWKFTDEEYVESATAFENEDFVATSVHSYQHRFANVPGVAALEPIEAELVSLPAIPVPTIILSGGADGVNPPSKNDPDRAKFTGYHERHILPGVGHCPPAEAPEAVAAAVEKLLNFKE